jgi:hypothetical protein
MPCLHDAQAQAWKFVTYIYIRSEYVSHIEREETIFALRDDRVLYCTSSEQILVDLRNAPIDMNLTSYQPYWPQALSSSLAELYHCFRNLGGSTNYSLYLFSVEWNDSIANPINPRLRSLLQLQFSFQVLQIQALVLLHESIWWCIYEPHEPKLQPPGVLFKTMAPFLWNRGIWDAPDIWFITHSPYVLKLPFSTYL